MMTTTQLEKVGHAAAMGKKGTAVWPMICACQFATC
jgi:hypothetical protein